MDRTVKRDLYYWRFAATGFCFAAFGIGGFAIGTVVAPLLRAFIWNRGQRQNALRLLSHNSFRVFIALMKFVGVLTYEIHGRERLTAAGQLVIATHPTLIDVVFLVACIPNAVCVVKEDLLRTVVLGRLLCGAGYIGNADPQQSLLASIDALNDGATLVMFPEGTRSSAGPGLRLHRGAAYIAIATHTDLTPVRISCTPSTLTKAERWHDIPSRRIHFVIRVGRKISIGPATERSSNHVAARAITEHVRHYFLGDTPPDE